MCLTPDSQSRFPYAQLPGHYSLKQIYAKGDLYEENQPVSEAIVFGHGGGEGLFMF